MNWTQNHAKRLGLRQPSAAFSRAPKGMASPTIPANPQCLGLRWQAQRDTAFARPKTNPYSTTARPPESAVAASLCRRSPNNGGRS
jgi:hypothetical protein